MTTKNNHKSAFVYLWMSVLVIFLDQLTKYLVSHHIDIEQSVSVLPFLNFTVRFNTGAAFSFLNSAGGWQVYVLAGISIVVSIGLLIWLCRLPRREWPTAIPVSLILGGALGNLIDRVRFGYVIDFIDFHIRLWHFATFNVADSAVSIGAAMLVLGLCMHRRCAL